MVALEEQEAREPGSHMEQTLREMAVKDQTVGRFMDVRRKGGISRTKMLYWMVLELADEKWRLQDQLHELHGSHQSACQN